MSTESQVSANRENAKKSTGPKTKEGKSESSKNATTHGLTAHDDVVKYESQEDFDHYRNQMIEDLNPIGLMQHTLAERIISLSWRLKRAERIQNQTIEIMLEEDALKYPGKTIRKTLVTHAWDPNLALGRIAEEDFTDEKLLERLMTYERRIENSLFKTIKELKKLKNEKTQNKTNYEANRRPPGIGPFYLPDRQHNPREPGSINQNMQNEPNYNDQTNITPVISEDYDQALQHGYPPDKPYPPISNPIKPKNTPKDIISRRNGGRSEAQHHPRRPIRASLNKQ